MYLSTCYVKYIWNKEYIMTTLQTFHLLKNLFDINARIKQARLILDSLSSLSQYFGKCEFLKVQQRHFQQNHNRNRH